MNPSAANLAARKLRADHQHEDREIGVSKGEAVSTQSCERLLALTAEDS